MYMQIVAQWGILKLMIWNILRWNLVILLGSKIQLSSNELNI